MKTAKYAAMLAAAFWCLGAAQAAEITVTLGDVTGKVLVSNANGFAPGDAGAMLLDGMKVLVSNESQASVVYDGCVVLLDKPVLYTVNSETGCLNGSKGITAMIEPTADLPGAAGVDPYVPGLAGIPVPALLAGGAIVATTTFIVLKSGKKNTPVSGP
jgi:hypothetical protein